MEKQIKQWVAALRSGKYEQDRGQLQSIKGYCCLGVACKEFIPKNKLKTYYNHTYNTDLLEGDFLENQPNTPKWLINFAASNANFYKKTKTNLVSLNDYDKFSFDEIADCLELVYIHKALD